MKAKTVRAGAIIVFLFYVALRFTNVYATPIATITDNKQSVALADVAEEYVDENNISPLSSIDSKSFQLTKGRTLNYSPTIKSVWLKFSAANTSTSNSVYLNIAYSNISYIRLYKRSKQGLILIGEDGNRVLEKHIFFSSPDVILNLNLANGEQSDYLIHVESKHPIILPASITTVKALADFTIFQTSIISGYLGILIIMFLYNLFLYFSTNDRSYLYYVVYIFFLMFAQLTSSGYSFQFLWPNNAVLNDYAVIWTSSLATITGVIFSMIFLNSAKFSPKWHVVLKAVIVVYLLGLILSLVNLGTYSYYILNYNSLLSVLVVLIISIDLAKKGYRPAIFYLIAWFTLLLSFIVLVFINLNWLPYNTFTAYAFYAGSAIEIALLSLALADRINLLKKEKEESQNKALKISMENERLVREQNLILEKKVVERTKKLQKANNQVTTAFKNLKDTQIQLVESEKMASLGQLTAGIAHEINNPINFVKSNIKPLQLDFKDLIEVIDEYEKLHDADSSEISERLKEIAALKDTIDLEFVKSEIESLMKGIENGAERTAEIVRGLRTFSRLDESVIKTVNIHEGIDTTLILLRNNIPSYLKIDKHYLAEGVIECFPGKLNQVFMNLLSNAIHAIKTKPDVSEDERITISTKDIENNQIQISIKDSGKGMSEEVKQKIYEPFFTTKDVGEGTGLGLAIVFKIIQEHAGRIEVLSEEGTGTEFILTLNHSIPEKANKIR